MAENANLTPNDDVVGGTEETPTPENTSEGQEEKETPETSSEGIESKPEDAEELTYKERFANSAHHVDTVLKPRLSQLERENETLKIQMAELANKPNLNIEPPSDKELEKSIPDWDLLSPAEQRMQKDIVFLKRENSEIKRLQTLSNKELLWERSFGEMTLKSEFSVLKAKKEEFSLYCSKHPYTNIEVLARSFLFDESKNIGAEEVQKRLNRKGLEKGVGGTRTPVLHGMTEEEQAELRKKNPLLYSKLLKEGKIQ